MNRADREDLSAQQDAVTAARENLSSALHALAAEAGTQQKAVLRGKRDVPTNLLDPLRADMRAVERAEELLHIALHDLATAGGADA